jgi:hypothetical protein
MKNFNGGKSINRTKDWTNDICLKTTIKKILIRESQRKVPTGIHKNIFDVLFESSQCSIWNFWWHEMIGTIYLKTYCFKKPYILSFFYFMQNYTWSCQKHCYLPVGIREKIIDKKTVYVASVLVWRLLSCISSYHKYCNNHFLLKLQ